jgi:hypothetical protein
VIEIRNVYGAAWQGVEPEPLQPRLKSEVDQRVGVGIPLPKITFCILDRGCGENPHLLLLTLKIV